MADEDVSVIVVELNKLKKSEIIDLITVQKLPTSFETNNVLNKVKIKMIAASHKNKEDSEIFHDNSEVIPLENVCLHPQCIKRKIDYEVCKVKVESLIEIKAQLANRLVDQKTIIDLLKSDNKYSQSYQHTTTSNHTKTSEPCFVNSNSSGISSTALSLPSKYDNNNFAETPSVKQLHSLNNSGSSPRVDRHTHAKTKITNQQVSKAIHEAEKTQKIINTNNSDRSFNRKQNKMSKVIIGSNRTSELEIQTIPKRGYLHVYRLVPETTTEMLNSFLKKTAPSISFMCEKLEKKDETSTSFKVSFPISDVDKVYDSSIWPHGAAVRRFIFPRRNFHIGTQPVDGA